MKQQISLLILIAIFSFNSKAQNWSLIPSGTTDDLNACSYGSSTHVYITGSASILKSINGGLSFSSLSVSFLPLGSYLNSCFFTSQDTGFVVGEDMNGLGFIFKTTNGGSSWVSVLSSAPGAMNGIAFPSALIGYAISGSSGVGTIYKTLDGGTTWNSIYSSAPFDDYLFNLHLRNNNEGYIVGLRSDTLSVEAQTIKITAGSASTVTNYPLYYLFTDVQFLNADTGFITALDFNGSQILKTTNGGSTWTTTYTNLNDDMAGITFPTNQKGYAVGTGGTIVHTTNGGSNWVNTTSPTMDDLYAISHLDSANMIAVGAFGAIIKTTVCTGSPTTGSLILPPSCSPIAINGIIYNTSGNYTQILTNTAGCDSTLNISLTIHSTSNTNLTANSCTPYTLNGTTYSMSGTYTQNYLNSNGCDSIITLSLVIANINANISQTGTTLTANPSGASYQWLTCPTFTPIVGATNQSYNVFANGSYAVKVTQGGCSDTSVCKAVIGIGLDDYQNEFGLEVIPNPSNGVFTLKTKSDFKDMDFVLYTITGQTILQQKLKSGTQFNFDISSQPNGIYFLDINSTKNGLKFKPIKVYKN